MKPHSAKKHLAVLVLYISLLLVYFFPLFQSPNAIFDTSGDFAYYYPERFYGFSLVRRNILPLWNPYILSGAPYIANYASAVFYLPNLLFVLMPAHRALYMSIFLHMLFAGYCTFLLCRYYNCSSLSSCAGGLVFMLSAFMTSRIYGMHSNIISLASWIPITFLFFIKFLDKPGLPRCLLFSASCSFLFLTGGAQIAYYMGLFLLIFYGLNKMAILKPNRREKRLREKELYFYTLSSQS